MNKMSLNNGRRLLLASASPRRHELMRDCGLEFEVVSVDVEEHYPAELCAEQVPEFLAKLKSEGYTKPLAANETLVTADTVVILKGEVLGKPIDRADAVRMLKALSGVEHQVVTGICLRTAEGLKSMSATTRVWFRSLKDEEIDYYVDNFSPMDKAGSYGIQEWIGYVGVERIEGSFYNVMGLPIQLLYTALNTNLEAL